MALNDWYDKYKIDVAAALKKGRLVAKEDALRCTLVKLKDNTLRLCCHVSTSRVGAMVRDAKTSGAKVVSSGILYKGDNGPTFEVNEGDASCKAKFSAAAAEAGAPMSVFVLGAVPAAPTAKVDLGGPFRQRLKDLLPHYNASIKNYPDRMTALRPLMTQLVALGNAEKYDEATTLLDQVQQGLRALPPLPPPPPPPAAAPPGGKPPAKGADKKQFLERMKEVMPRYQEGFKANPEKMKPVRPLVVRVQQLAKSRKYAEALPLLERVEKGLLAVARGEEKAFAAEEDFRDALAAMKGPLKEAVDKGGPAARDIKLGVSEALTLSRKGDFEAAQARLEEVEKKIVTALGLDDKEKAEPAKAPRQPPGIAGPSPATSRKCRQAWAAAVKKVNAELDKIQPGAAQERQDQESQGEKTEALRSVVNHLRNSQQKVSDKMVEALEAADPEQGRKLNREAAALAQEFFNFMTGDPVLRDLNVHGLIPMTINQTLNMTLTILANRLGA